jgi:hypothetical protein
LELYKKIAVLKSSYKKLGKTAIFPPLKGLMFFYEILSDGFFALEGRGDITEDAWPAISSMAAVAKNEEWRPAAIGGLVATDSFFKQSL